MGNAVKYFYGTDAQIQALTSESANWHERAFYYPSDRKFFYQVVDGVMVKRATGAGCSVNGEVIGGVKRNINEDDLLYIPEDYEYNVLRLNVDGAVEIEGILNII